MFPGFARIHEKIVILIPIFEMKQKIIAEAENLFQHHLIFWSLYKYKQKVFFITQSFYLDFARGNHITTTSFVNNALFLINILKIKIATVSYP